MRYKLIEIEGGYLIPVDEAGNEILIPDVVAAEEIMK